MVTSTHEASQVMIVARPNHSSTWRNNLLVLLALSVPSLGAAIGFALLGAWPILPFAGLELLALGSALYYVNWKLQYRHVITLSEDSVRIDKGFYLPRQTWLLQRRATGLAVTPERHPWEGPDLVLHDNHERVTLGEFLNRDDSLKLLDLLKREISLRTHSHLEHRGF